MYAINDPLGRTNSPASSDHYSDLRVVLFCEISKSGNGRKDRRTDNTCEYSYHYQPSEPWLWVGLVDQQPNSWQVLTSIFLNFRWSWRWTSPFGFGRAKSGARPHTQDDHCHCSGLHILLDTLLRHITLVSNCAVWHFKPGSCYCTKVSYHMEIVLILFQIYGLTKWIVYDV